MTKRILLWLNAFIAAAYFTGHLFDFLVVMPNWRAGEVELLMNYRSFFSNADPGAFFRIIVPASVLLSVISFLAYWKADKPVKVMLGMYLALTVGAFLFTMFHHLPINNYLFWGKDILEPARTMDLAQQWVLGEHVRVVCGFVSLIIAGRALHLSYPKALA